MKTYPVHEVFSTFQGEGIHMGRGAFFIRLFGCPLHCPWCFGKGTRLHTNRGMVDVSNIKVGDFVWSFNEKTQKQEWTKVMGTEKRSVSSYYDLAWRKKKAHSFKARVTGDHPFWVVGKGWVKVKDLRPRAALWKGSGRHTLNEDYDVLLEIDKKSYLSALRSSIGRNQSEDRRAAASKRMRLFNPMKSPEVREKVSQTQKHLLRTGQRVSMLSKLWKTKKFQKIVSDRMKANNPIWKDDVHARSCNRPFGMVSKIEKFVNSIIEEYSLPFIHNRGKICIGRRVPDFVFLKKKKVVEVTHPTYQHREENGYHLKNKEHYRKFGYQCLTLYVNRSMAERRRVQEKLTEFAYNGKDLLWKKEVQKPITVYSIRTENHTFFAEGVLTHNCDSAGTWHPDYVPKEITKWTDEDLAQSAAESGMGMVVITGGEPCIHDLYPLTEILWDLKIQTHLETSGAFPISGHWNHITLSPKDLTVGSKPALLESYMKADELKIIVDNPDVPDKWCTKISQLGTFVLEQGPWRRKHNVWLHPEWSQRENPEILKAITDAVKTYPDMFRAGWQLHKLYRVDAMDSRSQQPVPLGGDPAKGF